ncbi:MAG: 4'-phosphopantetheinyl transferase family protein [Polyangiales bacterium]
MTGDELRIAIQGLFSRAVVVDAKRAGEHELFPEEAAVVANAVASRRADFAAGRAAARSALSRLGVPACAIPSGARRSPTWPAGIVGSISHAGGWAVAAVARASDVSSLGIDIEVARPLPSDVEALVVLPQDRLAGGALASTLAFSAKESVYKAIFPAHGLLLEFEDVTLDLREDGSFDAIARSHAMRGRWSVASELVATAVSL